MAADLMWQQAGYGSRLKMAAGFIGMAGCIWQLAVYGRWLWLDRADGLIGHLA